MNKVTSNVNVEPEDLAMAERQWRLRFLRTVAWIALVAFSVLLLGYAVASFYIPGYPIALVILNTIVVGVMVGVLRLLARGRLEWGALLGLTVASIAVFIGAYFLNGMTGPAVLIMPVLVLIAGEVGGRRYAVLGGAIYLMLYIVFTLLETTGVLLPYPLPKSYAWATWILLFAVGIVVMVATNDHFVTFMHTMVETSRAREEVVRKMSEQAHAMTETERAMEVQTVESAHQIQEVAREYVAFLERIAAGDYTAALNMEELARRGNVAPDLLSLGEYLNKTVASLVAALAEAQRAQQTYLRRSWEDLMETRQVPGGYRYRAAASRDAARVEVAEDAWLTPMSRVAEAKEVVVEQDVLAVPLAVGGRAQLIGALGVRRDEPTEWDEDELAFVTTLADQLAQTLDNLRLLDETTRRAAREQMVGEITGHIREAVEIEVVLQRALAELGRAFAAEHGLAYLALKPQEEEQV